MNGGARRPRMKVDTAGTTERWPRCGCRAEAACRFSRRPLPAAAPVPALAKAMELFVSSSSPASAGSGRRPAEGIVVGEIAGECSMAHMPGFSGQACSCCRRRALRRDVISPRRMRSVAFLLAMKPRPQHSTSSGKMLDWRPARNAHLDTASCWRAPPRLRCPPLLPDDGGDNPRGAHQWRSLRWASTFAPCRNRRAVSLPTTTLLARAAASPRIR